MDILIDRLLVNLLCRTLDLLIDSDRSITSSTAASNAASLECAMDAQTEE